MCPCFSLSNKKYEAWTYLFNSTHLSLPAGIWYSNKLMPHVHFFLYYVKKIIFEEAYSLCRTEPVRR